MDLVSKYPVKKPILEQKVKKNLKFNNLKIALKYRPDILKLIIKLRRYLEKRNKLIVKLKKRIEKLKKKDSSIHKSEASTQIGKCHGAEEEEKVQEKNDIEWNVNNECGDNKKSIADQVKEAALSAMGETGMVYIESAGMYYDYKTGYYYNSELGLYYHPNTGCYYYYSEEKKTYVFHSYPDTSKIDEKTKAQKAYEKNMAKKHKKEKEEYEPKEQATEPKRLKKADKKKSDRKKNSKDNHNNKLNSTSKHNKPVTKDLNDSSPIKKDNDPMNCIYDSDVDEKVESEDNKSIDELEDGECSATNSESSDDESEIHSTPTASDDDDSVSRHHPPCMRVIVRETKLPKLKVGSLFLVTKDGGTIGREGDQHAILLRDTNVSRIHLDIKYDISMKNYIAVDLGSKNGTILNGHRMSDSQEISPSMVIPHGSVIQLGDTKLLCHIHPGNNTCGHCEPGLIMEAEAKDKQVAYTRTCDVKKQHQLELARLRNKYGKEPLAIEDSSYNDRAKARRETIGSTHNAEKTQQSDLNTNIAEDNKGFKLLSKMGWSKGEGLGKDNQGDTEPVPLVGNESKAGLGAAGAAVPVAIALADRNPMKFVKRNRPLRPPAKAFLDPLEDDDE